MKKIKKQIFKNILYTLKHEPKSWEKQPGLAWKFDIRRNDIKIYGDYCLFIKFNGDYINDTGVINPFGIKYKIKSLAKKIYGNPVEILKNDWMKDCLKDSTSEHLEKKKKIDAIRK